MSYDALGDLAFLPPKRKIFIWRLTLMCGHLKLWGPFTDGSHQRYIGDHCACDICPAIKVNGQRLSAQQLIVKVEEVDPNDCSPEWIRAGLT